MKFKKRIATILLGLSVLLLATDVVAAATWYSSKITLPRNGFWYSKSREATANSQKTKVTKPKYDVVSHIANSDKRRVTSNQTHKKNKTDTRTHKSNMRGTTIKAAFRSSIVNQRTNTVNLSWQP